MKRSQREENVVFGLDIGTRSVVGTVGYMMDDKFYVVAQHVQAHETRAMLETYGKQVDFIDFESLRQIEAAI